MKCNGQKIFVPEDAPLIDWLRSRKSFEYQEDCVCGKAHFFQTQKDDNPEYYTDVYLKCDCGEYVWFGLPVN